MIVICRSDFRFNFTKEQLESRGRRFSYKETAYITKNFSTMIGEGGFGKVYHGKFYDGTQVAVKLLSSSSRQGCKEFQAEVCAFM